MEWRSGAREWREGVERGSDERVHIVPINEVKSCQVGINGVGRDA